MKRVPLKIREADRRIYDALVSGAKTVESRAATPKYMAVEGGDVVVFECGQERLEKTVESVRRFDTVDEMFAFTDYKLLIPGAVSPDEAKRVIYSFPGNEQKIGVHGIVTFKLGL